MPAGPVLLSLGSWMSLLDLRFAFFSMSVISMLIQRLHTVFSAQAKSDGTLRSSICDQTHTYLLSVRALIQGQQAAHARADTEEKYQDWPHNKTYVHA